MPEIVVSKREGGERRCSYCHEPGDALLECPACRTLFHRECRRENAGCPTLGCREPWHAEATKLALPVAPVEPSRWRPSSLARALLAAFPTFALFVATVELRGAWGTMAQPRPGLEALSHATQFLHGFALPVFLFVLWAPRDRRRLAPSVACAQLGTLAVALVAGFFVDDLLGLAPCAGLVAFAVEPVLLAWLLSASPRPHEPRDPGAEAA